jgi:hypothetical protein
MRALPFIILAIGVVEQAHLFARAEEDEPDIEPDSEPSFEFEDTAEPDIEDAIDQVPHHRSTNNAGCEEIADLPDPEDDPFFYFRQHDSRLDPNNFVRVVYKVSGKVVR